MRQRARPDLWEPRVGNYPGPPDTEDGPLEALGRHGPELVSEAPPLAANAVEP